MFKIDGKNNIFITRGDSATLNVEVYSPFPPYSQYQLQEGDVMVLTVRERPKSLDNEPEILIQKTFSSMGVTSFEPSDTSELEYGEYVYDVQLTMNTGEVHTVIPSQIRKLPKFIICGEVT